MDALASYLSEHGPFDGLAGFDEGGCVAFQAARRAQEGDPAFVSMFRFLVLFTTYLPRELAPLGGHRPRAPLQIPVFISFSELDIARPYAYYEEPALYFDETRREVYRHSFGHQPPRMTPELEGTSRLKVFLKAMRFELPWVPADSAEKQQFQGLWLPIIRTTIPALPAGAAKKLLIVHEPDLGERVYAEMVGSPFYHGRLKLYVEFASMTSTNFQAAAVASGYSFDILSVEYSDEQRKIDLSMPFEKVPTRITMDPQDIVPEQGNAILMTSMIAKDLISQLELGGYEIGVVGIGQGAIIALQFAKELIANKRIQPAAFWAVVPPCVFPTKAISEKAGLLIDCPVRYLIPEHTHTGVPWRWEIQTFGPFSTGLFRDRAELVQMVLSEFEAR